MSRTINKATEANINNIAKVIMECVESMDEHEEFIIEVNIYGKSDKPSGD